MEYRILDITPTAPDGATTLESYLSQGYQLHGGPFVWREKVLQAVIRHSTGTAPSKLRQRQADAREPGWPGPGRQDSPGDN